MKKNWITLAALLLLVACANTDKKTLKALEISESAFMERECQLNSFFVNEPEFFELKNKLFCSGELEIIKLEEISETEAIADYKITFQAKQKNLKEWLAAYNRFQARISPSPQQLQVKTLIEKLSRENRDWVYQKQTVKLTLTEDGWTVDDVIR